MRFADEPARGIIVRVWPKIVGIAAFPIALIAPNLAHAATTNPAPIAVPLINVTGANEAGAPYPSSVDVVSPGGPAWQTLVSVVLHKVTHPCPEDLAVLLVRGSSRYLLMSHAGGCRPLQGTDVTIVFGRTPLPDEDASTTPYGESLTIGASVYGPPPLFPAPAPAGPYTIGPPEPPTTLQGTWELYVMDTNPANRGVIAAGWSIAYPPQIAASHSPVTMEINSTSTGGRANVYPIAFDFDAVPAGVKVHNLQLRLRLTHTYPDDLRIVLQSPSGTAVVVMANAGGMVPVFDQSLYFSDSTFAIDPPDSGPLISTDYKVGRVYDGPIPSLPTPAPLAPYNLTFGAFTGQEVRGIWFLWVYDDYPPDDGGTIDPLLTLVVEDTPTISIDAPTTTATYTANQPFLHIEATVEPNDPLTGPRAVTWRATTPRGFHDAGPMTYLSPTRVAADIPLAKGDNVIDVFDAFTIEYVLTDRLTVTVNEFTYHLAEGSTGGFFDEDVTVANPSDAEAPARIEWLFEGGAAGFHTLLNVPPNSQIQLPLERDFPPSALGPVSAVVHAQTAMPVIVERTMSWDDSGYGGHGGNSTAPHTHWLFAEGSQGFFQTFVLLANDNLTSTNVTIRFLLEGGGVVTHVVTVAARGRVTVYAGDIPALADQSFGIDVTSAQPIIAERSMYFSGAGGRLFEGGHESPGVNATSTRWYLAEGATGPFFDTFVLLSNPTGTVAHTTLTYLLPSGETITRLLDVPANGRATVNVETVDARLLNTPVSTTVTSDVGIIVERSMYWPDISSGWREAHNSLGVTTPALRWGVADGRTGGTRRYETYILLANPNPRPAEVEVAFLKGSVRGPVLNITLPATSRHNVWVNNDAPGLGEGVFSADVRSLNYQPIIVEKAMYWDAGGMVWAAGTGVVGTPLPPR